MARPRHDYPTPAELEVLQILWETGGQTGRAISQALARRRPRAYTSLMSLLNVMTDKGLLERRPQGRAFLYAPRVEREKTLRRLTRDLAKRAFDGSASALLAHLLDGCRPSEEELVAIRGALAEYETRRKEPRR